MWETHYLGKKFLEKEVLIELLNKFNMNNKLILLKNNLIF